MNDRLQPLVSVVSPAYNEEENIAECIESVLAQTYANWEYTVVNNCSTDRTGEIAQAYAAKDSRIRVVTNTSLLPAVANFNFALRQISSESKYCKMVLADDWMFPECLERMTTVMEKHPSVGIVGSFGLKNPWVLWQGLPYPSECVSGREVCRKRLQGGKYVFGSQTTVLYRADLVRSHNPFYRESNKHPDSEICLELLKCSDFGFIHQVLTFSRDDRANSMLKTSRDMNTAAAAFLHELVTFGPYYLSEDEYSSALHYTLRAYYEFLGISLLQGRDRKFWDFHINALKEAGIRFKYRSVVRALGRRYQTEFRRMWDTEYWGVRPAE
jgi:glycosyltransferase involved in cell wall biosynthesis